MKRILLIGKDSYIGESFMRWLCKFPEKYRVDITSSIDGDWKRVDFTLFETVVSFAGIAHVKKINEEKRDLFYSINRDLSIEIAKKAKQNGVKHFIVFSSMNVYGDYCDSFIDRTIENPTSFYGDSKLQGDNGIKELVDDSFLVSFMRPPFVYGKNCRGNYKTISMIAKKTLVFPTYRNRKSMIYIDNLCEFLRLVIDEKLGGILTPQNRELISTSDLVREIAKNHGKRIWFTGLFNWMVKHACKLSRSFRRAFADDFYPEEFSCYWNYKYCVVSFSDSIKATESE